MRGDAPALLPILRSRHLAEIPTVIPLHPDAEYTLSASHAQVRQLPQRLQELLGFNQPTPYLGFINGRHPRDWLMNNQPRELSRRTGA